MIETIVATLGAAALGGSAFVRMSPVEAAKWHVDPEADGRTGPGRYLVAEGGDRPPLTLSAPPAAVIQALDRIALATPRTERLVWEPDLGRATYVTRSRVMGFPDFTSVKVSPDGEGSAVAAYARLRYGREDMGVNRKRVTDWLTELGTAL